MKRILLSVFSISLLSLSANSQTKSIDLQNTRQGESVEYCIQHKKLNEYIANNLSAVQGMVNDELIREQEAQSMNPKATILYVPVVFHILHNGGSENISEDQIVDAMFVLNRDFALMNSDASNVDTAFTGMPSNVDIQFRLATKAPDGSCFKGITRTQSVLTNNGSSGSAQVTAIVNGNDVYNGTWPGNKYLNIFVAAEIGGAAGYTTNPNNFWTSSTMNNGIWVLHNYTGSIGTSGTSSSRTLTHEVGHWLNLSHVWGPNNNPGNASSCASDDGVQDTPTCIGLTTCLLNSNSCTQDNAYWGFDKKDNTENYMDYSYCSKMFTQGQVDRMRTALQSTIGGRSNVMSSSNLTATGADGNLSLCVTDFSADRTSICAGEQIQFTDESYNAVSGWTWTFTGADVTSSNLQNPTVTYSTPGLYSVTLNATDGTSSVSEVKTNLIRVLPAAQPIPFVEGFESFATLANIEQWEIVNNAGNGFEIETTVGHSGTKCAKIINFGEATGEIDELISAPIDLTSVSGPMTLSFRYAYKRITNLNDDWLRVYVTGDCGQNWALRKTIHGGILSSDLVTTSFTPSSIADWKTVHMTNVTNTFWTNNFRCKFQFEAGGGNNFYIDNINIYPGAPSDQVVVGINENDLINNLSIYPNPTTEELNLEFSISNSQDAVVAIQSVDGKIVQRHLIHANSGTNLVMMNVNDLSEGVYFIKVNIDETFKTLQFIVK